MKKFKTKPAVIRAAQFNDMDSYLAICDFAKSEGHDIYKLFSYTTNNMYIETLEGKMKADPGDWIIYGLRNEFYPCKPDVFQKKYEDDSE